MTLSMKRIGIDARMAKHSGIGRYIRGFTSNLNFSHPNHQYLFIGRTEFQKTYYSGRNFVSLNAPIYSLSEQILLPIKAKSCNGLHVPHYNVPIFWQKKLIVTIHDLIHLEFAQDLNPAAQAYSRIMLSLAIKKADAVICVSHKTKQDLIEKLGASKDKITVIHHGVDPIFQKEQKKMTGLYFLCVGIIKSHKNLGILLDAFIQLRKKSGLDLKLRIVGKPDLKQKIVREWLNTISNEPNISLNVNVNDEELRGLYTNAAALVFPSLYEGFGFPILEAMASQTPVIAAHVSSIPEVAGNAALYFDPHSNSDLMGCMEKILGDSAMRNQLIQNGAERVKQFTWEKATSQLEHVYESVI